MPQGSYGIPHKENLPAKVTGETGSAFWLEEWFGNGTRSTFIVEPEDWWTVDEVTDLVNAAVVMEFKAPTNLTHAYIKCDNNFIGNNSEPMYCEYSHDNMSWTRMGRPAVFTSYYTSGTPTSSFDAYIWIPRSKIKAKYWKIAVPQTLFSSDYGDDEWHVSNIYPGSLDNVKDIIVDTTDTGVEEDLTSIWNTPPDKMPWFNAGKFHKTDVPLKAMFVYHKDRDLDSRSDVRFFWMDEEVIRSIVPEDYNTNAYKAMVTLLTKTGFTSSIGMYSTANYDPDRNYFSGVSIQSDNYVGFGWPDRISQGVSATRSIDLSDNSVPNKLGADTDCILVTDGTYFVRGLTHPDYPTQLYRRDNTMTPDTVTVTTDKIFLGQRYTDPLAGVLFFKESTANFQAGEYTGTGSTGLTINTTGLRIKVVLIKRKSGTASNMIISMIDTYTADMNTGNVIASGVDMGIESFILQNTAASMNESGAAYLWWAWG